MKIQNIKSLIGKTKQEIIEIMGEDYLSESDKNVLIYIINKKWFNKRGSALFIEFNENGIADTVFQNYHYEF